MSDILKEADALADGTRSCDYGPPLDNHRRIADIWNVQCEKLLAPGCKFTPDLVALMMIGVKLSRLVHSPTHRDSVVDICGYGKVWDVIQKTSDAS